MWLRRPTGKTQQTNRGPKKMARRRTAKEEKDLLQLKKERIDARLKKEEMREREREISARIKRMGSR